nr:immunoglobulin light chain junction region [Macaca mulatta]MOY14051.1 immunoglobulin light chain junction region [Macaca mulatta]
CQQYNSVPYSF